MSDLSQRLASRIQLHDRVQPCLLDKLLMSEGKLPVGALTMSLTSYIESVSRDLTDLLCERALLPEQRLLTTQAARVAGPHDIAFDSLTLGDFPEAAQSVLTFGLPDLTGMADAGLSFHSLERLIEEKIRFFEPRFGADTLKVRILPFSEQEPSRVRFKIEADLWAFPKNEQVDLTAEIDMVNNQCNITS